MPVDSRAAISENLLSWYDAHRRSLPWRAGADAPAPEPYAVWLSEIMLQQTTVAAVKPYFAKFLGLWPTVEALARADEADVMSAWAGLGYYARARNLIACARAVTERHDGSFPDSEAALRALPGIGDYTAAAIAAIAFGRRAVVMDANIERVTARLFAFATPLPAGRHALRGLVDNITPDARCGDFAQAMMDLGATICTARSPNCLLCPLAGSCAARAAGEQDLYPVKTPKRAKPTRRGTAWWIEHDRHVLLIRRPASGLLGGMRAFPSSPWTEDDEDAAPPIAATWLDSGTVHHVFTHFALDLSVRRTIVAHRPDLEGEWWPVDDIASAGLPTLFAHATTRSIAAAPV